MSLEKIEELENKVKENDPMAMNALAIIYESGNGVKIDKIKSMKLFEKAAELNYPNAMVNYAIRIYDSDEARAIDLLNKAANLGFYGAFQMLGYYADNTDDKLKYFLKASDLGDAESQFQLGCIYYKKREYEKAFDFWKLGADRNNKDCCYNLARLYLTSEKLYNTDEAVKYAEKMYKFGSKSDKEKDFVLFVKMWSLLCSEFNEEKKLNFWTNLKGASDKFFSTAVSPVSEDIRINDLSVLIFETVNELQKHVECIECGEFVNAFYCWKDYKEGKINLKAIRPAGHSKYIVSIFHLLDDKLDKLSEFI